MNIPYDDRFDGEWREVTDEEWLSIFMPRTVYDRGDHDYACICPRFEEEGRCRHLYRLRRQIDVPVDPRYL